VRERSGEVEWQDLKTERVWIRSGFGVWDGFEFGNGKWNGLEFGTEIGTDLNSERELEQVWVRDGAGK